MIALIWRVAYSGFMEMQQEIATFGGGCFWCTEAIFQHVRGVSEVVSGYAGGEAEAASYETVASGRTRHAEAIQVQFDPQVVSYDKLLEVFWGTHDPTTLNQQGADVGSQYRSVIFYHSEEQRKKAEAVRERLEEEAIFADPIVTEIVPFTGFYPAEEEHRDFYNENPEHPYCQAVIDPKIAKFFEKFSDIARKEAV